MIRVHSRHTPHSKLEKKYPDHTIVDVTSRGAEPWVRFSPFYPHGEIPVPGLPGVYGASVEGIWQGLKVFETAGTDLGKLTNTTMKKLKRSERRFGRCLGHRLGEAGLLDYATSRYEIFLPSYRHVLENHLTEEVAALRDLSHGAVVLLDYMTNCDVDDLRKPLSHAGLIAAWIEDRWPG